MTWPESTPAGAEIWRSLSQATFGDAATIPQFQATTPSCLNAQHSNKSFRLLCKEADVLDGTDPTCGGFKIKRHPLPRCSSQHISSQGSVYYFQILMRLGKSLEHSRKCSKVDFNCQSHLCHREQRRPTTLLRRHRHGIGPRQGMPDLAWL